MRQEGFQQGLRTQHTATATLSTGPGSPAASGKVTVLQTVAKWTALSCPGYMLRMQIVSADSGPSEVRHSQSARHGSPL